MEVDVRAHCGGSLLHTPSFCGDRLSLVVLCVLVSREPARILMASCIVCSWGYWQHSFWTFRVISVRASFPPTGSEGLLLSHTAVSLQGSAVFLTFGGGGGEGGRGVVYCSKRKKTCSLVDSGSLSVEMGWGLSSVRCPLLSRQRLSPGVPQEFLKHAIPD